MRKHHLLLYFIEFAIVGGGFALLLSFNFSLPLQLLILTFILGLYIVVGLIHHKTHRDINLKVVLEYILISALVFALFVFLNITRI
jgi:hypothetical protein